MERKLPTTLQCTNSAREWAVIGGGPSINDCVGDIRKLQRRGVAIVSVNKSHDWLLERGIVPWAHVLLDPKEWVADYVQRPRKDVRYLVASQCHPDTFDRLNDYPVFLWHAGQDFEEDGVEEPRDYLTTHHARSTWHSVPGATTVGLRTPTLGHLMPNGADKFHMFGMDSSRTQGKLHAYAKDEAKDAANVQQVIRHCGFNYQFDTNSHMARQYEDFDKLIGDLAESYKLGKLRRSFSMKFYGSGLLPFYAAQLGLHAKPECNLDPVKVGGFVNTDESEQSRDMRLLGSSPAFREMQGKIRHLSAAEVSALAEHAQMAMPGPVNIPAHMLLD